MTKIEKTSLYAAIQRSPDALVQISGVFEDALGQISGVFEDALGRISGVSEEPKERAGSWAMTVRKPVANF